MAGDDEADDALIDVLADEPDVVEMPDGSAIIRLDDEEPVGKPGDSEHFANLAESLPEADLNSLATDLLHLIEIDRDARKRRDELYAEGIKRTGLGDEAPGGAKFAGASRAVHPMMVEACVDFSSRAMKELFPRGGPVKDYIPGKVTEEKIAKAKRKTTLMNWQLTKQCREFRAELEQLVTQIPMGGDQYLKITWDEGKNRPDFLFVGVDEMYLPFAATNFYTAQRRTHVQYVTRVEFDRRVKTGMYRDVNLIAPSINLDVSATTEANDKVEGRENTSFNEDGLRIIYEVFALVDVEEDVGVAPYIISIDQTSREVLAVYRNWMEDDDNREELQCFVQWPFIPWRGAYSIGLTHMIGGLAGASTGALRALLDSAHIQNAPSALKLKGGKIGGQTKTPQPGEITEIEGGFAADDIRKVAMPLPFNGPSPTLFQLLGFLVDAGKGVVRTALDDLPDMQADVPVGTTLARIEQGLVVFSAIHGRLHDAMQRLLDILHRLNGLYLDDENLEAEVGEKLATRADFQGPMDVAPVSDPNIFSEVQRVAQAQTVAQRADIKPELYDLRKVEEMILTTLKVPGAEQLLVPPLQPKEQNAINENVAASLGRPITAFPEQDHLAHLLTHVTFMQAPLFGASPMIAPQFIPLMLGHLKEHVVLWYASSVFETVSDAVGKDLGEMLREMSDDSTPEERKELDKLLAEAGMHALDAAQQQLQALPEIIQQAQALMQQFQQQPPMDPIIQLENRKIDQKAQSDGAKIQQAATEHADDVRLREQEIAAEQQDAQLREAGDTQRNTDDNETAMDLAMLDAVAAGQQSVAQNPNPTP